MEARLAIEDLLGAGAIIHHLGLPCSPEAEVARNAFRNMKRDVGRLIRASVSGRELVERGFADDVDMAVALEVSVCAPLLAEVHTAPPSLRAPGNLCPPASRNPKPGNHAYAEGHREVDLKSDAHWSGHAASSNLMERYRCGQHIKTAIAPASGGRLRPDGESPSLAPAKNF